MASEIDSYLGGLGASFAAELVRPKALPGVVSAAPAKLAPAYRPASRGVVGTPNRASPPQAPMNVTRAPVAGRGSPPPPPATGTPSNDTGIYTKGGAADDSTIPVSNGGNYHPVDPVTNLPTKNGFDPASTRAGGARKPGFPWILALVAIAAYYALSEEK